MANSPLLSYALSIVHIFYGVAFSNNEQSNSLTLYSYGFFERTQPQYYSNTGCTEIKGYLSL